jgi:hypothetical protein
MSFSDVLSITPNPALSLAIWFVALTVLLYLARVPAHSAINSLTRALYHGFRLSAKSVLRAEQRLTLRNREVLLAHGREAAERMVEREFDRIDAAVNRDLGELPGLQRQLNERLIAIEEDHKQSTNVPPTPPGWVEAVEAVANIPSRSDPVVGQVLEVIHTSLVKAHDTATNEYRKATQQRHGHLKNMIPGIRKLQQILSVANKNTGSLLERSKVIDRQMDDYESIIKKTDQAERMLSSSSLVQFFIAGLVLVIAIGGAVVNFNLIARPMSEMVGGTMKIGGFRIAEIAALVIILLETTTGLFMMEAMRITRLFPIIGALKDKTRLVMFWCALGFLFVLASVEAGLAYMREILMQDDLAMSAMLRGDVASVTAATDQSLRWITTAAQMGLGFILPFVLTFVAIPLESFVHSFRTVLGVTVIGLLRGLAYALRLLGGVFRNSGGTLLHGYDFLIFGPLWIEKMVVGRNGKSKDKSEPAMFQEASS